MSQDLIYALDNRKSTIPIKQQERKVRRVEKGPVAGGIGKDEPEHLEDDEVTLSGDYLVAEKQQKEKNQQQGKGKNANRSLDKNYQKSQAKVAQKEVVSSASKLSKQELLDNAELDDQPPHIDVKV